MDYIGLKDLLLLDWMGNSCTPKKSSRCRHQFLLWIQVKLPYDYSLNTFTLMRKYEILDLGAFLIINWLSLAIFKYLLLEPIIIYTLRLIAQFFKNLFFQSPKKIYISVVHDSGVFLCSLGALLSGSFRQNWECWAETIKKVGYSLQHYCVLDSFRLILYSHPNWSVQHAYYGIVGIA